VDDPTRVPAVLPHRLDGEDPACCAAARLGRSFRHALDDVRCDTGESGDEILPGDTFDAAGPHVAGHRDHRRQREQPEGSGWTTAVRDPAVRTALLGIHSTPSRQWTVASLGELAGLSRAAFARRFTALIGQPPLTYLTWWRMILAARLLRGSDAPLRTVAEQVGYSSEFAFGAAFKRQHGQTPGAYRRTGAT
jgi:AraC-like DNA-binding protein